MEVSLVSADGATLETPRTLKLPDLFIAYDINQRGG